MCACYNVIDSPEVRLLCELLGIHLYPETRRNIAPGNRGQFIIEQQGERQLIDGIWSLLIEPKSSGEGYRPNPAFKTFNARSDRLTSSKLWKRLYPARRAIVPASAYHEWAGKQCYSLSQPGRAIAFGALYSFWRFGDEMVPSFSIITLPAHPKLQDIHDKSLPLMLEPMDFDLWLDPAFKQTDAFADLCISRLRHDLAVQAIESPVSLVPAGDVSVLASD